MLEDLRQKVEENHWEEARVLADKLYQGGENSDVFWILNSAIYEAEGEDDLVHVCITRGLWQNPYNYELYFMLGNYYSGHNVNQAWLCYEYAEFCCGSDDDSVLIRQSMERIQEYPEFCVQSVSVVTVVQDHRAYVEQCVESIRKTNAAGMYELIAVDCGSDGETLSWLEAQNDIRVLSQPLHKGKVAAWNWGMKAAAPDNDIFLLNSVSVLPPRALFWLRMGLYERETVGAAGPHTNLTVNQQEVDQTFATLDEYMLLSERITISDRYPYENKLWLSGFAMLIKRTALDETGLLDLRYGDGIFQDMDYGMKLVRAGYELLMCHNSFVYCYSLYNLFRNAEQAERCQDENSKKIKKKWGFPPFYYSNARNELIDEMEADPESGIRVLEIGCGVGGTLAHIRYRFPHAQVHGIELMEKVAAFGKYMARILTGDIETMRIPYEPHSFDYVMFGDVLEHLRDPGEILREIKKYIKPGGRVIASIPNIMNISVVAPLLRGHFTYKDEGLLDRTHIHFFTRYEIEEMFRDCGYEITGLKQKRLRERMSAEEEEMADAIYRLPGIPDHMQFEAYQYIVVARPE